MKRIVLFIATNVAVMIALSITLNPLGAHPRPRAQGLRIGPLPASGR